MNTTGFLTKPTALAALVLAPISLSGCVVWDIHEQIVLTNERLTSLEAELDLVREANQLLAEGNAGLDEVHARLETMDSIDESLKELDGHLASLRATIDNIDSTIPFLRISSDRQSTEGEGDVGGSEPASAESETPDNQR